MISQPHQGDHEVAQLQVERTDTREVKLFEDAWLSGWVGNPLNGWDCRRQGYFNCGVDVSDEDSWMRANQGYWINTYVPKLVLIFP